MQLTKNQVRYRRLMADAAKGSHEAAQALIVGEWWPGNPDSKAGQERVIRAAQRAGYPGKGQ